MSLKGWVRAVFVAYRVVVVLLLTGALFLLIARAPVVLRLYGAAFLKHVHVWGVAWHSAAVGRLALESAQLLLLLVSAVFLVYGVGWLLVLLGSRLWAWGRPSVQRRALAALAAVRTLTLLLLIWSLQLGVLLRHR